MGRTDPHTAARLAQAGARGRQLQAVAAINVQALFSRCGAVDIDTCQWAACVIAREAKLPLNIDAPSSFPSGIEFDPRELVWDVDSQVQTLAPDNQNVCDALTAVRLAINDYEFRKYRKQRDAQNDEDSWVEPRDPDNYHANDGSEGGG